MNDQSLRSDAEDRELLQRKREKMLRAAKATALQLEVLEQKPEQKLPRMNPKSRA